MSIRGTRDRRLISKGITDGAPPPAKAVPSVDRAPKAVTESPVAGTVEKRAVVPVVLISPLRSGIRHVSMARTIAGHPT